MADKTFPNGLNVGSPGVYVGQPGRSVKLTPDGLDFVDTNPSVSPLSVTGVTLAVNTNVIRGIGVAPTRASGWIAFTGTVTTTPAAVYTDYRELHTAGVAEVLGIGTFPFMDTGASCASMFALQAICEADAGSTVLTAGGAPAIGIFPLFAKCLLNGETFDSGGVAAAAFLSVQANVTDVQAEDTSIINAEVASGGIQNIIKFQCSAAKGATYFVNFTDDNGEPASVLVNKTTQVNDVVGSIKVLIGAQVGYINVHAAPAA